MALRFGRVLVTPSIAKRWLAINHEFQRNEKGSKISQYARDMASGNWNEETGQTIKFSGESENLIVVGQDELIEVLCGQTLVDGQNRLRAVTLSGAPIWFDVAYNLPPSAMLVLDTGASRTGGDALKIAGATDRMRTSAIVRWVILWDALLPMGVGGTLKPTNSEIVARYNRERGLFNNAATRATDCQRLGLGTGSPIGVANYLFGRIDKEQAHAFFDQYISGENLSKGSAALTLRNRMARVRLDRITRPEQLALFIRAWNAFRKDEPINQLIIVSSGELSNTNFPTPK